MKGPPFAMPLPENAFAFCCALGAPFRPLTELSVCMVMSIGKKEFVASILEPWMYESQTFCVGQLEDPL